MNDSVEHRATERPDPARIVNLCDQGLTLVGLPTYSDLAGRLNALEATTLGTAIAETRRLRTAHTVVGSEIGAAMAAFAIGDAQTGMNLLDEAKSFAGHHAVLETAQPQPENVVLLAAHRIQRVAADLRRL